jgi:hypothetical protein
LLNINLFQATATSFTKEVINEEQKRVDERAEAAEEDQKRKEKNNNK